MTIDEAQLTVFLRQIQLDTQREAQAQQLRSFFAQPELQNPHVILKNSVIYYFDGAELRDSQALATSKPALAERNVYAFDGEKVSRLRPGFYLSPNADTRAQKSFLVTAFEGSTITNNNNNNNNNNGNNNNG